MKIIDNSYNSYSIQVKCSDGVVERYTVQPSTCEIEYNWKLDGEEFYIDVFKQIRKKFLEQMQISEESPMSITQTDYYIDFVRQRTVTFILNHGDVVYNHKDMTYNL